MSKILKRTCYIIAYIAGSFFSVFHFSKAIRNTLHAIAKDDNKGIYLFIYAMIATLTIFAAGVLLVNSLIAGFYFVTGEKKRF